MPSSSPEAYDSSAAVKGPKKQVHADSVTVTKSNGRVDAQLDVVGGVMAGRQLSAMAAESGPSRHGASISLRHRPIRTVTY
jgi:hypothetical protein